MRCSADIKKTNQMISARSLYLIIASACLLGLAKGEEPDDDVLCSLDCQNGGTCEFSRWGPHCRCEINFYGDRCEKECTKSCQNDGVCVAYKTSTGGILDEFCICPPFFEGELCQTARPCEYNCQNEGVCKSADNFFNEEGLFDSDNFQYMLDRCTSRADFTDPECTFTDPECTFTDPECTEAVRDNISYCECPPDTDGDECQFKCDLECDNGGICQMRVWSGEKWCSCPTNFIGDTCQYECTKECQNGGVCRGNDSMQWCECSLYYEGDLCQSKRSCDLNCLNDGKCDFLDIYNFNGPETFEDDSLGPDDIQRCLCTKDWVGTKCEEPCPCQNGGECTSTTHENPWWGYRNRKLDQNEEGEEEEENELEEEQEGENGDWPPLHEEYDEKGYFCECPFGYHGEKCELKYISDDCKLNCRNGGYCRTFGNMNSSTPELYEFCVCPSEYKGSECEEKLDLCKNQCQNGGVCTSDTVSAQGLGNRALESAPRAFCQCPEGFSGEFCERKTCGSGYCANGGTCIELSSGETTSAGDNYVCDCSTTGIVEGVSAIGRNCEAIANLECPLVNSELNPNEPWTCSGVGRCYMIGRVPGCDCVPHRTEFLLGPRCEFDISNPVDVAWSTCNLQCSNDGICLKGASKPVADIFIPFVEATKKSGLFEYPTPDFEYCYCPDGYFGVQCDKTYELCGTGEHICFHGSKCENNDGEWSCNCVGTLGAGLYCQHEATDTCDDDDVSTFCANGGTCTLGSAPVCACAEGWEGAKCETEMKLAAPAGGGDNNWSSASASRFLSPSVFMALVSVAYIIA